MRFLMESKVENVYRFKLGCNKKVSQMHNVSRGGVYPKMWNNEWISGM